MSDAISAPQPEPEWAAFAALDWADKQHAWRLVSAGSSCHEKGTLVNTPEAVAAWATGLAVRFGQRPIAVCIEKCRNSLVYMLSKYSHIVLFLVHPGTASRYRRAFSPSGAKDDPRDAASLLDLLLRHRHQLHRWMPDTVTTRLLQRFVEHRRLLVNEKTRQNNRLNACLKTYFPQLLEWFDDITAPLVGDLLNHWPTLQKLQRAHPGTLKKFFLEHNSRSAKRIEDRIQSIYKAVPVSDDEALLIGEAAVAAALADLLKTLRKNIELLDQKIEQLVAVHPDAPLFNSLPGAGPVTVARLIVAFGSNRERYGSAYDIQSYSGIAPIKEASGNHQWVHFRWTCPKFLRQTFHEFAFLSIRKSEWAKAYYRAQRDKEKSHPAAVRALAFKWIRIIFRCWKTGQPYDEQIYQRALQQRRKSPLTLLSDGLGWTEVAGFKRLSINT